MGRVLDEVRKLADIEHGIMPNGEIVALDSVPNFMLQEAWDRVETAVKADADEAWDILNNGSDREFSALINCIPDIGGEFDRDEVNRELMQIAKVRLKETQDYDRMLISIKSGFGVLFDQFWNESELDSNKFKHAM